MSAGQRVVTLYYLLLALGNAWMTWFIPPFITVMAREWQRIQQDRPLPACTETLIALNWWPIGFLILFVIGALISLVSDRFRTTLIHTLIVLLMLECLFLLGMMFACAAPCIIVLGPLGVH